MSTRYLKRFFNPRSIAVFGASSSPDSLGGVVIRNLQDSGYQGHLYAVHRDAEGDVFGVPCYQGIATLPEMPELAVICSDAERVPELIRKLGANEVRAALVLSGGYLAQGEESLSLREAVKEAARPYGIRIIGPDCLGILVPASNLNASYSHLNVHKGKIGYVGQSGIMGTAMIDWANGQGIGFSHFLTIGDSVDVDLPSVLDYLAADPYTKAIVLQLNQVTRARHFISAVRAASRNKLVLILKSGFLHRNTLDAQSTTANVDEDAVYDAVLRRAGVLRVTTSDEVFNALETLSRSKPLRGERLAILCNGMGPNALAVDALHQSGGTLAELSEESINQLAGILPPFWNRSNPIDLNSPATPERFAHAIEILARDKGVDAILVIHAPTRMAPSIDTAEAILRISPKVTASLLTSFMGRASAIAARNLVSASGIPTYITPEKAIEGFMHLVHYRRNQEATRQTPPNWIPQEQSLYRMRAKALVEEAQSQGRDFLFHAEVMELLNHYGISTAICRYANDPAGVIAEAQKFPGTVAVKVLHQQNRYPFAYDRLTTKRWQDMALDLAGEEEMERKVMSLNYRAAERYDDDQRDGFLIQEMKRGFQSMQMHVGITQHPVFGPLILFGVGGYTVDVLGDRQLGIPPLNLTLARLMIQQSRVARIIAENSYQVEEDIEQIARLLVKLAQLAVDLPQVSGLEINPLLLNKQGLLAVDASVSLGDAVSPCILPYPEELREWITLKRSGTEVELRPIRGEDEPAHLLFYKQLSPETVRLRYFYSRAVPEHQELANWAQIDYDREMAFIATRQGNDGQPETLGVVRAITDADNVSAEFSIVIRDDMQGEGLGRMMMQKVINYCRERGTLQLEGATLPSNSGMQKLASALGFTNKYNADEEVVEMRLPLNEPKEDWQFHRLS
ncbi:GNAT family N-acetyltransferase [Pokkaliibacter sp. CJK22405]|uniref:bifunctional acetate--CoA ligase family protein/GNAT family N-acetyltransferase n=1 Tax=Pokkaliibacter sp. CJK22405 TaxID=3384615 RepID=UPI00398541B7